MKKEKLLPETLFLILGQINSLFANTILRFVLSMYILELTGSASIFAGLLAVSMIPTILLSPFGGILADRQIGGISWWAWTFCRVLRLL